MCCRKPQVMHIILVNLNGEPLTSRYVQSCLWCVKNVWVQLNDVPNMKQS